MIIILWREKKNCMILNVKEFFFPKTNTEKKTMREKEYEKKEKQPNKNDFVSNETYFN